VLGLPHLYLGYWIGESRKMAYKARFRPLEGRIGGSWRDVQHQTAATRSPALSCSAPWRSLAARRIA
jgi:arginyl-tRNA--protein-N-Asp/Glu arginylyltransferase